MAPGIVRAAALTAVSAVWMMPAPAAAQEEVAASGVDLSLHAQPPWHEPEGDLDLRVRVTNRGADALTGFRITVAVGDVVRNRSALHESFSSAPSAFSSYTRSFGGTRVSVGERAFVTIDDPVATLTSLTSSAEAGVYPLTVTLFGPTSEAPLDAFTTFLLLYPERPANPLYVVPVVPLGEIPSRGPDGAFVVEETGSTLLESGLRPGGWLTGQLDALERWTAAAEPARPPPRTRRKGRDRPPREPPPPPLRLALAPLPRFVDELADMADGYRVTSPDTERVPAADDVARAAASYLDRLEALVGAPTVQALLVPYSSPDLPSLHHHLGLESMAEQLSEGARVLEAALDLDLTPQWLLAPAGRLDAQTLEALHTINAAQRTFLDPESVLPASDPQAAGCPEPALSFTCPVRVTLLADTTSGYVLDADIQDRLAELARFPDDALDVQRTLAETAMIHAEQPGVGGRIVPVVLSSSWRPKPRVASSFFRALSMAPWIKTATPQEGLQLGSQEQAKQVPAELHPLAEEPDRDFFASVKRAAESVESFRAFTETDRRPERLRAQLELLGRNILTAESRLWWEDDLYARGESYLTRSQQSVETEMKRVSIVSSDEVTLTSRQGQIPFSLVNANDYPIRVELVLVSTKLDIEGLEPVRELPPGTSRLTINATAQSSGQFLLEVRVRTTDGFAVADTQVRINSTELNQIALWITLGALAFLIFFYLWRSMRRRAIRREGQSGAAEA